MQRAAAWEVGCDEAGRGALAGPVTAAAVCLPRRYTLPGLRDSKQVAPTERTRLALAIRAQATWAIATASAAEIDKLNILQATFLAMHRALFKVQSHFRAILVDGKHFRPYKKVSHRCIVRGDSHYDAIAAASILAKTCRDAWMRQIHAQYPMYNWSQNKGYPTLQHKIAIRCHGLSPQHRKTFRYQEKT